MIFFPLIMAKGACNKGLAIKIYMYAGGERLGKEA